MEPFPVAFFISGHPGDDGFVVSLFAGGVGLHIGDLDANDHPGHLAVGRDVNDGRFEIVPGGEFGAAEVFGELLADVVARHHFDFAIADVGEIRADCCEERVNIAVEVCATGGLMEGEDFGFCGGFGGGLRNYWRGLGGCEAETQDSDTAASRIVFICSPGFVAELFARFCIGANAKLAHYASLDRARHAVPLGIRS